MHPGSIFSAANPVHAKQGEMVDVNVHKKFSTAEFFVVYLLPVIAFFGGLFLGSVLFSGTAGGAAAVGLAFVFLVLSMVANVVYKKRYQPFYTVSIVKVIRPAEPRL